MYEVEYQNGYTSSISSSETAADKFSQMDENENCYVCFLDILIIVRKGRKWKNMELLLFLSHLYR